MDGRIAEPHDPSFIVRQFGGVMVVRLEVTMDQGVGTATIRFVEVFRGDER